MVHVYNGSQRRMLSVEGVSLQWPGGSPPLDVPVCSFKNDAPHCLASKSAITTLAVSMEHALASASAAGPLESYTLICHIRAATIK